jgi:hypothetical protein
MPVPPPISRANSRTTLSGDGWKRLSRRVKPAEGVGTTGDSGTFLNSGGGVAVIKRQGKCEKKLKFLYIPFHFD